MAKTFTGSITLGFTMPMSTRDVKSLLDAREAFRTEFLPRWDEMMAFLPKEEMAGMHFLKNINHMDEEEYIEHIMRFAFKEIIQKELIQKIKNDNGRASITHFVTRGVKKES